MPISKTIANAKAELDLNRKWRAKEIISSSLISYDYNEELFAFYGEILLSMEDTLQAGRYLFFSKENLNEEEQHAVDIFIERHSSDGFKSLILNLPDRKESLHLLPDYVQSRLIHYGAPKESFDQLNEHHKQDDDMDGTCLIIGLGLLVGFLVSAISGLITIFKWLF